MGSSKTNEEGRALPGKMVTLIGKWSDDRKTYQVTAEPLIGATEKATKEAIRALGHGTYDLVTGRLRTVTFKEVTRDAFA